MNAIPLLLLPETAADLYALGACQHSFNPGSAVKGKSTSPNKKPLGMPTSQQKSGLVKTGGVKGGRNASPKLRGVKAMVS